MDQKVGDESLNLEETIRGSVEVTEDIRGNVNAVYPEVTDNREIEASDVRVSPGTKNIRTLRE